MSHPWMRSLPLALMLLLVAAPTGWAQKKKDKDKDSQDPMSRQRNVKPEIKQVYKKWLNEDVAYIITDEEKKAFKKLQTDEEREQFIEAFWRRRNPDPDSDENEYREQYYERIAYANQHFASGIPGWRTDRGRIYITFGKPDEVESHPAGGPYERESYEGGGETETYPFERWFYRYIPGVGSGVEIEFVDPTGSGEYHIARSPDEKDAMLNVPGAGLTLNEQLGLSSKADRIANVGGYGMQNYQREQDSPFSRLELLSKLDRAPEIKGTDVETLTSSPNVEENLLNPSVRVDFFRQSDEKVMTAFTIQTDNKELAFEDVGGVQTARLNIFGKITSVAGRKVGTFEDPVITTATVAELTDAKERKSAYQKAVPLAPGRYKVDVIVRDVKSGAQGVVHLGFEVPKYDSKQLSTSTLVLAARLQSMGNQPAVGQFVIGQNKVIPNVAGIYRRGEPVGLYMQIYNAGIDQTTLRPSVDVQYVLTKSGKEVGSVKEDWRGTGDAGQRLTLARLLPTNGLPPGDYEIAIRIRDHVSGQSLSPSAKFTVTQ